MINSNWWKNLEGVVNNEIDDNTSKEISKLIKEGITCGILNDGNKNIHWKLETRTFNNNRIKMKGKNDN